MIQLYIKKNDEGNYIMNFISKTIFREYDIRGIYEKELHENSVKLIGYFLGHKVGGDKIVSIGYDARSHSPILRDYLISGLNAAGCKVLDMGMVATPVNYYSNYVIKVMTVNELNIILDAILKSRFSCLIPYFLLVTFMF